MEDKTKALQGGPWVFDKQLILLSDIQENMAPLEINFSHVSFWVRGYDIPFANVSKETTMALANNFGGMEEYPEDDDLGWSRCVAFRAEVNIKDPLLRGAITNFGEVEVK